MKPAGVPLPGVGRAARFRCEEGETWLLPRADAAVATRLLALGAAGVGGFVEGGTDDDGAWLLRRAPARTLADLRRGERQAWREAMAVVRDLARALEACERAALFPGPMRPKQIALEPAVSLSADELVGALVGASSARDAGSSASPAWTPPEQAAGAAWDHGANRYVLGLVAYRLLSGHSPFGGSGLRFGLASQQRGAPPFDDEIARPLRPGVQSFVLKLLAPNARERPPSAAAIVIACRELLGEELPPSHSGVHPKKKADQVRQPSTRRARSASAGVPKRPAKLGARSLLPIAVGAVVACMALAAGARKESRPAPAIREVTPLRATEAGDCAPCHAREVAEWERSVMAHAVQSPLFGALESLVEEQVGRDADCPNGAGILRRVGTNTCRTRNGFVVTGSGGEEWCVNCHAPGDNLGSRMPAWSAVGDARSRAPVRDLVSHAAMEGISCASCHETIGPVGPHGGGSRGYEGNPTWISTATGRVFPSRPEDLTGRFGIANSGYRLDASVLLGAPRSVRDGDPVVHRRAPEGTHAYLRTSEFCGACHDVRLFGTDILGASLRGEHFKRLRNAYSEWRIWADAEARAGREAATCQGCHMSLYPGVCAAGAGSESSDACPAGTHFEPRPAGERPQGLVAPSSTTPRPLGVHYFTSIDLPLTPTLPDAYVDDLSLDEAGQPIGLRARRDLLLKHTFRFAVARASRSGTTLEIPVVLENTGAGHRVPAGFSQERETWVEMKVTDGRGAVVYEVGRIEGDQADLRDKVMLRVRTDDANVDGQGKPLGLFGADVVDGPDVPEWTPSPREGGTRFRGRGLINLQNGFLRCVRCIGIVDAKGECRPGVGQEGTRAGRFDDGQYDADTGECRSNLSGGRELFETYFPVGALDADRGIAKAPDAIVDTRSAPPGVPLTYTYVLETGAHPPPFTIRARLRFRSFPPYLVRAFAAYEADQAARGRRPSGPQVTTSMLRRIEVVDLAFADATVP